MPLDPSPLLAPFRLGDLELKNRVVMAPLTRSRAAHGTDAPRECGVREARVTKVAFHPRALVLAIGYADGLILLCRLADAAEILVRRPGGGPIGALAWDARGARLLFGLESGEAGLLNLPG